LCLRWHGAYYIGITRVKTFGNVYVPGKVKDGVMYYGYYGI
jgi:hypothetical protein